MDSERDKKIMSVDKLVRSKNKNKYIAGIMDREDFYQESMLRLVKNIDKHDPERCATSTWAMRACNFALVDNMRQFVGRAVHHHQRLKDLGDMDEPPFLAEKSRMEVDEEVNKMLGFLDNRERRIVRKRIIEGVDLSRIAKEEGLSSGYVVVLQSQALQKIKDGLEGRIAPKPKPQDRKLMKHCVAVKDELGNIYPSIARAAEAMGVHRGSISTAIREGLRLHGRRWFKVGKFGVVEK